MTRTTDYSEYTLAWRQRIADEAAQCRQWKQEARTDADRLARILGEDFSATEVYLFGSLALPWDPGHKPDIDLATRGLSLEAHSRAWSALERETSFAVDLVRLEEANERLLASVADEGELLWDAARSTGPSTAESRPRA